MNGTGWPTGAGRVVLHIDMDAFFAAVEERFLPILKDRPVIVGGGPDQRGVATTANYAARKFGVHSAMPLREASRLCPDAHFISSSEGAYGFYSARLFEIFSRFAPKVEPTSVDEAFAEVTGMERHFPSPADLARALKKQVHEETGLTCSVGIAPNKLLAKMASSQYKPDGLFAVDRHRVAEWLAPQPVGQLWGVGARTEESLAKIGVHTIGDLQALSLAALTRRFGKWGEVMHRMSRGHDDTPVLAENERPQEKSIGNEHTFDHDTPDPVLWHATLLALCDRVGRRLRQAELFGRTITLKFRTSDFRTTTHADSLQAATDSEKVIFGVACRLLEDLKPAGKKVRLLGVSVSKLSHTAPAEQPDLFGGSSDPSQGAVSEVVDKIRDRFGSGAIGRLGTRRSELRRF
jgi:DNA polymerase-4